MTPANEVEEADLAKESLGLKPQPNGKQGANANNQKSDLEAQW